MVVSLLSTWIHVYSDANRHLMTGTGAYYYIVWGVWLRHCLNFRQDEYELLWLNFWTVPEVVKRGSAVNSDANASTKKKL